MSGPSNSPDNKSGADAASTEEVPPSFDDMSASRQKTIMQSFLLYNIASFADRSLALTPKRYVDTQMGEGAGKPSYSRVMRLEGPPTGIINKLTMASGSSEFIEMKPHEISNLVPMIRMYKILYNGDGDVEQQVEFQFPTRMDKTPGPNVLPGPPLPGENFIVGPDVSMLEDSTSTGVGIKSFDYQFIGSNPATVRNDIKAKMVLYFQSFAELLRVRYSDDGYPYAYIDLFSRSRKLKSGEHPENSPLSEATLSTVNESNFGITPEKMIECDIPNYIPKRSIYDPIDFEMKVAVGWADPTTTKGTIESDIAREAGKNANYAMFLTLVDHGFDFEDDGTFTLTLNYRARTGAMLSDNGADVLDLEDSAITLPPLKDMAGGATFTSFMKFYNPAAGGFMNWENVGNGGTASEMAQAFKYYIFLAEACCDDEALKVAKEALTNFYDFMRSAKYMQFTKDMIAANALHTVSIDGEMFKNFVAKKPQADRGQITSQQLELGSTINQTDPDGNKLLKEQGLDEIIGKQLGGGIQDAWKSKTVMEQEIEIGDAEVINIKYVYLGDIVEVMTRRAMGGLRNKGLSKQEASKVKVLLGNVDIASPVAGQPDRRINIADIPIAFETFRLFWHKKVIESRRNTYPLLNFLRDVIKFTVHNVLNNPWVENDDQKGQRLILRAANISLPAMSDGSEPLENWMSNNDILSNTTAGSSPIRYGDVVYDTTYLKMRTVDLAAITENDPLSFQKSNVDAKELYNYIVLYLENGSLTYMNKSSIPKGLTRKEYDKSIGIHHFGFGEDRGILKTAKFSKTDQPYLREARYASHRGFSPFDQLSSVYDVEITTFGAPFYYPGQYVWIEPRGLGYSDNASYRVGSPDVGRNIDGSPGSIAYEMGLGGYHIITEVGGYLEDGKYETKIKCRYDNSGADRGERVGHGSQDEEEKCPAPEPTGFFGTLFG